MDFTGNQLTLKRNFFTQTGNYGFSADITVDNTTGVYHFGLTGSAGVLDFRLESGRLYYGSEYLHSYSSNREFTIEGQFTSGSANIIKDGAALVYNEPKSTGYFDYFYFTRQNASLGASFDVNISGNNTPLYTITTQGYLLASGQSGVTGYFLNQSQYPIKVFDSNIQATQNYTFGKLVGTIGSGTSGAFAYTGNFDSIDLSQPILTTFDTNFDDDQVSMLFTITDARTLNRFVYLTGPTEFSFNSTGILNRDLTYLNYSGGFVTDAYPAGFGFYLSYVSGAGAFTGDWDLLTGLTTNTLVSVKRPGNYSTNMISGSGLFEASSQMTFQVTHNITGSGIVDGCYLVISGREVLNPIAQSLTNS